VALPAGRVTAVTPELVLACLLGLAGALLVLACLVPWIG
jgi:hypothetical protein